MTWAARYVGIPFVEHGRTLAGLDCWGLYRMAYADRFGVALPDFDYGSTSDNAAVSNVIGSNRGTWQQVSSPVESDAILMRLTGWPCHIGMVLGAGRMLHARPGQDVCVERYDTRLWANRIEGFYRPIHA